MASMPKDDRRANGSDGHGDGREEQRSSTDGTG